MSDALKYVDKRGDYWGYLPEQVVDLKNFFEILTSLYGLPEISEELVIFFKENIGDVRLRLTNDSLKLIRKHKPHEFQEINFDNDEYSASISLRDAENFIRILDKLNFSKGLFSIGQKLTFSDKTSIFRIRLNSEFGDFFQIKSLIDDQPHLDALIYVLEKLNIIPWTNEEYNEYINKTWKNKEKESLINENGSLNSKIKNLLIKYEYSSSSSKFLFEESIQGLVRIKSNDYSDLERIFKKITNEELVSEQPINYSNAFTISASIIIPLYKNIPLIVQCLNSICRQDLTPKQFKAIEVIIVDDGSPSLDNEFVLQESKKRLEDKGVDVLFLRHSKNKGRSFARNVGAKAARNQVLIFIDSDICLDINFIKETLVRHQFIENIALVSFKENINLFDLSSAVGKPDFKKDFRYSIFPKRDWVGLYPVMEQNEVRCLEATDNFKSFGFGKILGPYDLPCMVVTHNLSINKSHFIKIGGFEEQFGVKWGYEDTLFGACLIAIGIYIVPLLSTGVFHMETESERINEVRERKISELHETVNIYNKIIHQKGYLYAFEKLRQK